MKIFFLFFFFLAPVVSYSLTLSADTVWEGKIIVHEDIVVPEHVTLTVRHGTMVKVSPAESSKIDPEYASPLTEITVYRDAY